MEGCFEGKHHCALFSELEVNSVFAFLPCLHCGSVIGHIFQVFGFLEMGMIKCMSLVEYTVGSLLCKNQ